MAEEEDWSEEKRERSWGCRSVENVEAVQEARGEGAAGRKKKKKKVYDNYNYEKDQTLDFSDFGLEKAQPEAPGRLRP